MTPLQQLAIEEAPAIIGYLKVLFHKRHPDEPVPTSEEVILSYNAAYMASVNKDEAWKAAHPE